MGRSKNAPPQSAEGVERLAPRDRRAVVRYKGTLYTGFAHIIAFDKLCAEHHITDEQAQDDLFDSLEKNGDCGFATTKRPFISRAEAEEVARKSGQLKEAEERENADVFVSEDVAD